MTWLLIAAGVALAAAIAYAGHLVLERQRAEIAANEAERAEAVEVDTPRARFGDADRRSGQRRKP